MIFFHGTVEENIKNIRKNGILDTTKDQWILEVTNKQVCCVSNQPVSGEGGNPSYFTYGNVKSKNQDGYLVVMDIPRDILRSKIIAVFDNKILDDYVRFHFFIREEFRYRGYELFSKMTEHRGKDIFWQQVDAKITRRDCEQTDSLIFAPQDQRHYYKKLRDQDERYMYNIFGTEVSDELFDLTKCIGQWEVFYNFLSLHFGNISQEKYDNYNRSASERLATYWEKFYEIFPMPISSPNQDYMREWFSPGWLSRRKMEEIAENCQILMGRVESEYVVGFIKITTPSGFAAPFRASRSKSGFSRQIWKEVHRMRKEKH